MPAQEKPDDGMKQKDDRLCNWEIISDQKEKERLRQLVIGTPFLIIHFESRFVGPECADLITIATTGKVTTLPESTQYFGIFFCA